MLYPRVEWQNDIQVATDISGRPTVLVGPNDILYFALSSKGAVESFPASTDFFSIVVGALDASGSLLWLFQDPAMVTSSEDAQPSLALGPAGDLYVTFMTIGAIPGATNGINTFSLCGNCSGPNAGPEDIVVARLNVTLTGASLVWIKQDDYLNSCNRETKPSVVFDIHENRLLIAYECTGATLCNVALGTPNIVLVVLDPSAGHLIWSYQGELLNARGGQNRNPSLTVDALGNIYIAYGITARVEGGGALQGIQDIEVVKLRADVEGCGLVVKRGWILSAVTTVNAGDFASNQTPSLVCDPLSDRLFLAFTTNGQVPGGERTSAITDLVSVGLTASSGELLWIQQGGRFNEHTYRYQSIDNPVVTIDAVDRNVYLAAHAYDPDSEDMIVMFRLNPATGFSQWYWRENLATNYRAYIPLAAFETPFSAEITSSSLSQPSITIGSGFLFLGTHIYAPLTCTLIALRQQEPVQDMTAFEYMANERVICDDNITQLAVIIQSATAVVESVGFTYFVLDEEGNQVDIGIPPASAPLQERIDGLTRFLTILLQTYVIEDENGNRVGLDPYTTAQEHVDALVRLLRIFLSTYMILDENGDPVNLDNF